MEKQDFKDFFVTMCVVAETLEDLFRQRERARCVDLVEYREDMSNIPFCTAVRILKERKLKILYTYRTESEGGYGKTEKALYRRKLIEAVHLGADAIDYQCVGPVL